MEAIKNLLLLLWAIIQTVGVWDILDILIIAYLIYRILTVLRRTSAGSVINGIVLVGLLAWLSDYLNLQVVNFILRQMVQMGVVVLVVLFQPELRKFFEQMGTRNLNSLFKRRIKLENVEACIQNVVSACEAMGKTKTGALIVFERKIGLRDYAATGTIIDAHVTPELLMNIFFHNSPLHDGAVILHDDRIVAAGCMLPMSNNTNISRELGMRHRAALGISERSDAVAVVVSEESGSISVAIDGMLKRHLARDTFEKLLMNELIVSRDKPERKARGKDAKESQKVKK